jgi:hypothetical protein
MFWKMFWSLNNTLLVVKVWQAYFLIFALGNDIQLTLAAIFTVIVSKKCVKFCGSWMQCAALRLAFLLVFSNIRFIRHTFLFSGEIYLCWHCNEFAYYHQMLTPSVLIGRLINAHQHFLALRISEYLGMNQVRMHIVYFCILFCNCVTPTDQIQDWNLIFLL